MNTLTLNDQTPYETFSRLMEWPVNKDLDAMLERLDHTTSSDLSDEIMALVSDTAERAFVIGLRCGLDPTKLIFGKND